jgi:LuxR family transcriptional regulator, maltose regulon positive regulatory protein
MQDSLLAIKLMIPEPRANGVPRPRLLERLSQGLNCHLTLVSAPAGWGKTTLLSKWAHMSNEQNFRVAWISLEQDDNHLTRFLSYLIRAFDQLQPGLERQTYPLLRSVREPPIEGILVSLINALTPCTATNVLVLDDYHVIHTDEIHHAISFLLKHLPPCLHLVLATRMDPPFSLEWLRAQGQFVEIRSDDLRFLPDETAVFLERVMKLALSAEEVQALQTWTEGWIAAIQLSALSLQSSTRNGIRPPVQTQNLPSRFVAEYLIREVLDQQADEVHEFLLGTAVLDHLNGPLCNAVLERTDSQVMLERLEHSNMFLNPLDGHRRWYHLHHLFTEMLRLRLEQTQPQRISALHRRASEWYEANGFPSEAIHHALAAKDTEHVADILERNLELQHRAGTLSQLEFETLPPEIIAARPQLLVAQAWNEVGTRSANETERLLTRAEQVLEENAGDENEKAQSRIHNEILVLRAIAAIDDGDILRGTQLAKLALQQVPSSDLLLHLAIAYVMATAYELNGEVAAALDALSSAVPAAEAAGYFRWILYLTDRIAQLSRDQGHLHLAANFVRSSMACAEREGLAASSLAGPALIELGEIQYEWNLLAEAEQNLEEGLALLERGSTTDYPADARIALARICCARGEPERALEIVESGIQALAIGGIPRVLARLLAYRALIWVQVGNLEAANHWVLADMKHLNVKDYRLEDMEQRTLARLLMAQGRSGEALKVVSASLERAEASGRMGNALEMLVLRALALQAYGRPDDALEALQRALRLGHVGSYVRVFVDEGPPMAQLLQQMCESNTAPPSPANAAHLVYVKRLVRLIEESESRSSATAKTANDPLEESLSQRELEVSRLIARGLSNAEIANRLCISVNTLKIHIRNVYGKLGVQNRVEFLVKAQELSLSPSALLPRA